MNNPSLVAAYQAFSPIQSERTRGAVSCGITASAGTFDLDAGVLRREAAVALEDLGLATTGSGITSVGCHSVTGPLIMAAGNHEPPTDASEKMPWLVPAKSTPLSACCRLNMSRSAKPRLDCRQ